MLGKLTVQRADGSHKLSDIGSLQLEVANLGAYVHTKAAGAKSVRASGHRRSYLPKGAGSIVSFGVKGGRDAGKAFIENVELASHLANVGDAKTLIIHPATTTHSRIDAEALVAAGITEDMIRLSVGLEDVKDIQADFENGFRAAKKIAGA